MSKYVLIVLLLLYSVLGCADEGMSVELAKVNVNLHDTKSILRGGKFFSTTCMVCHTLIYLRYDPLAKEAGVIYEKMPINVTKWPFDIKPPDLSLEASRRGVDWIYTYLHSFYRDATRPTGFNNLLVHNTAMTDILIGLQGQQMKVSESEIGKFIYHKPQWYDVVEQTTPGSMTSEQFDATITDVVNFLAYASEPYKVEQEQLGKWVILYLFILFILMYLLKKSYWKDLND